eukprot:TRINITY_DN1255_c0_g1_i5.p1 TRINITY_DN1255_c0_g1~~TRINITY_DN1255_c0_g1_i5.p1  ORF type:complete len:525 (+),score=139.98 TRINITY_DN1255_c0_g1_i5:280-1854(+)
MDNDTPLDNIIEEEKPKIVIWGITVSNTLIDNFSKLLKKKANRDDEEDPEMSVNDVEELWNELSDGLLNGRLNLDRFIPSIRNTYSETIPYSSVIKRFKRWIRPLLKPEPDDEIDHRVCQLIEDFNLNQLAQRIERTSEKKYTVGGLKRIFVDSVNGQLSVRVGGGYDSFENWIFKNVASTGQEIPIEFNKPTVNFKRSLKRIKSLSAVTVPEEPTLSSSTRAERRLSGVGLKDRRLSVGFKEPPNRRMSAIGISNGTNRRLSNIGIKPATEQPKKSFPIRKKLAKLIHDNADSFEHLEEDTKNSIPPSEWIEENVPISKEAIKDSLGMIIIIEEIIEVLKTNPGISDDLEKLKETLKKTKSELSKESQLREDLEQELEEYKESNSVLTRKAELAKSIITELEETMEAKKRNCKAKKDELRSMLEDEASKRELLQSALDDVNGALDDSELLLAEKEDMILKKQSEIDEMSQHINVLGEQIEKERSNVSNLEVENSRLVDKINSLEVIIDNIRTENEKQKSTAKV